MLWSQDAEVDESTAHGDVKVEREEFALHEAEGMSGKASEKQEACGVQGTIRLLGHFQAPPLILVSALGTHDVQVEGPYLR